MHFSTSNPFKKFACGGLVSCLFSFIKYSPEVEILKNFRLRRATVSLSSTALPGIVLRMVEASSAPRNDSETAPAQSAKQLSQMIEACSCRRKITKNYINAGLKTFSQTVEAPSCICKKRLGTC